MNESGSCANYLITEYSRPILISKSIVNLNQRDRISLCKFRCGTINCRSPQPTGRYQRTEIGLHDRIILQFVKTLR